MKNLLAAFLSLGMISCAGLLGQPDGWSCSFFYDSVNPLKSVFLCNRIQNPKTKKEFPINDPFMQGAKCMDLGTFKAYSDYVFQLEQDLIQCNNGG